MKLEDEIDIWLRMDKLGKVFPREVSLKRKVVKDEFEFYSYLIDNKWIDVYANVFAQWQKAYSKFDTVLIDIDEHSLPSYYEQIERVYEIMGVVRDILEREGLLGRWYFTGRGFHCYIDFPVKNLEYYTDMIRYDWARELFDSLRQNIDFGVIGDKNRMARIVGSKHKKTNLVMIRIEPEWELEKIIELSYKGQNIAKVYDWSKVNEWFGEYLAELDFEYREKIKNRSFKLDMDREQEVYKFMKKYGSSMELLPPCVKEGIGILVDTGELFHEWRFHIAAYLLRVWDREAIEGLFMLANDYNPVKVKYQLDYIERRRLYPYGCRKAKMYGICQFDDQTKCPFFHLTGKWIGSVFKDVEDVGGM